ncbi:MAG: PD40 domain-containing protein, partial [Chloroflexi bacterium]|nr:PD40 domain-containing protein [Chloroflexota bacterium]
MKFKVILAISLTLFVVALAGCSSSEQESTVVETETPVVSTTAPKATAEPDGSKIIFSSNRDGNFEIYEMYGDGSNQKRLTRNSTDDRHPAWSPDGSQIAFDSDRDDDGENFIKTSEIYVMDVDGTNQMRLTNSASSDFRPSWSPDSRKIVFVTERDGNNEIYVMDADGSNQMRLTNNRIAADTAPAWSPDGTKIAFYSTRDGNLEIYTMDPDGNNQTRLTYSDAWDVYPR